MHKYFRSLCLASTLPAALLLAGAAHAAPQAPQLQATTDTDSAVRSYWTPERLLAAKPMDLHLNGPVRHGHAPIVAKGARQTFQGGLPTENYDFSLGAQLFNPALQQTHASPPLVGSSGLPFTTNRLYPQNDGVLYKVFPYATVGHLFFTTPAGNFQCSASVIRRSVIATAGHCVADGNGNYYTNWMFVPAQNGAAAPFGTWTWSNAITSSAWWSGGGTVPNAQDDAVIILAKQTYKNRLHSLGDLTGWLGYQYNAPLPTAITQLGYPCNLDGCADPVATYSQDTAGPNNNFQWGTASFGGASGGPQIQDFGQAPSGVPAETLGGNILVSSTSYTYTTAGVNEDGGSVLGAPGQNGAYTFGDMINWACGTGAC